MLHLLVGHLQIKNIPPDLHEALRRRAAQQHMTMSDYALHVLRRELALPSQEEWFTMLERRPPIDLGDEVVKALHAARAERDEDPAAGSDRR
jgi:plasmid stability protein